MTDIKEIIELAAKKLDETKHKLANTLVKSFDSIEQYMREESEAYTEEIVKSLVESAVDKVTDQISKKFKDDPVVKATLDSAKTELKSYIDKSFQKALDELKKQLETLELPSDTKKPVSEPKPCSIPEMSPTEKKAREIADMLGKVDTIDYMLKQWYWRFTSDPTLINLEIDTLDICDRDCYSIPALNIKAKTDKEGPFGLVGLVSHCALQDKDVELVKNKSSKDIYLRIC